MSDTVIAAIARRVAFNAALNGYERNPETKTNYLQALTELCAAVKAERNEEAKHDDTSGGLP
jgi:hypothetical protein